MSNRFANGRKAFSFCDLCGFRFDLRRLKNLVVKTKETQIKACPQCWTPDQPQLQLGMYPISDPQAIRNPRPDTNTWYQSGVNALGNISEGMLVIQWGWNPVGGASYFTDPLTPNTLVGVGEVGAVTFPLSASEVFTTPGTYSWVAPAGVTSVYVLCVGGGGSGDSTVVAGGDSSFGGTLLVAGGGQGGTTLSGGVRGTGTSLSATVFGGDGGLGMSRGASNSPGGGGGAGGYSGNGGDGGSILILPTAGTGGAGAGGNGSTSGSGGGGVGLSGEGPSGITSGQGGSGGETAITFTGGVYGGGARGRPSAGLSTARGGGGGGGLRWSILSVTPGQSYAVVVGAGGGVTYKGGDGAVRINWLVP